MNEKIFTIPVNDGFDAGGECPFCNMYHSLENDAVDYILGAAYMEDDIRMETNKLGFCQNHYKKMYAKQNRLGLALMLHTHIQKINVDLAKLTEDLKSAPKKGLFAKPAKDSNTVTPYLNNITETCYVCNKIHKDFDRYFDTFFYMWKTDADIKGRVQNSQGFCLNHFSMLIETAQNKLGGKAYDEFIDMIVPIEMQNLKRLQDEVEWFTDKFDHRHKDDPWGTAKDALPRGLIKIASTFVEE